MKEKIVHIVRYMKLPYFVCGNEIAFPDRINSGFINCEDCLKNDRQN